MSCVRVDRRQRMMVDSWNRNNPPGTPVLVNRENGNQERTRTVGEAQLIGGHTAVIWLEGISGCYLLQRCQPEPRI